MGFFSSSHCRGMKCLQAAILLAFVGFCLAGTVNPPVYVTPYLPNNYKDAQNATKVTNLDYAYDSYSGFFTVDPQYDSNMFFWYFPAQNGNADDAPLLLWLQGGPGGASMFGLFNENGPFFVSTDNFPNLVPNNFTWAQNFSVVYIDNPVGAGFSYTNADKGYVVNESQVADHLYSCMTQFFQLFPNLADNDFYITGESYAGKYIPSLGYKIYNMNMNTSNPHINLVGLSIGDGMMDPLTQTQGYAELMWQMGLMDEQEYEQGRVYETKIESLILQERYSEGFFVFDEYLNADYYPYNSYYFNVTGLTSYFNFLTPTYHSNPYVEFLNLESTRNSIHVGRLAYDDGNSTVEEYLIPDWFKSVRYKLPPLLQTYKVLIYNGQNDIILGPAMCENFLRTLVWSGHNDFLSASKIIWKVQPTDQQVAGYVREVNNFRQIVVRNAGHILPADQPRVALDMITRFVNGESFSN